MRPSCVELAKNALTKDSYCAGMDIAGITRQRECNTHCQLGWSVLSKSHCSAHCGEG